jgi:hypothetical protein
VPVRIPAKRDLPLDRALDVGTWNGVFLRDGVRQDGNVAAVEEVEDAMVDPASPGAQLVDVVPEIVGLRSPEGMTFTCEAEDTRDALRVGVFVSLPKAAEKGEDRYITPNLSVEDDGGCRQRSRSRL